MSLSLYFFKSPRKIIDSNPKGFSLQLRRSKLIYTGNILKSHRPSRSINCIITAIINITCDCCGISIVGIEIIENILEVGSRATVGYILVDVVCN